MAIVWAETFEDGATGLNLTPYFDDFGASSGSGRPAVDAGGGRFGGNTLHIGDTWVMRNFGSPSNTWIVGIPIQIPNGEGARCICTFNNAADSPVVSLHVTAGNLLEVRTGMSTVVGTGTLSLIANAWHWVEIKVDTIAGTVEVRLDQGPGQTAAQISVSGLSLSPLQFLYWGKGDKTSQGVTFLNISYYYILNEVGTRLNDFLGDSRFRTVRPVSDDSVAWVPSTGGDNYALVDETNLNTADFVSSDVPDAIDMYEFGDFAPGDIDLVHFAFVNAHATKDAGGAQVAIRADSNTTVEEGTPQTLLSTGRYYKLLMGEDPDTGLPWTVTGLNGVLAGVRLHDPGP